MSLSHESTLLLLTADRREKAFRLIQKHGRNSFSQQILNSGTSLWFSRDEKAVAGYVLEGKTRITGGAPVTHPSNLKRAAVEFEEDAREHGHSVCYFGAETWLSDIFKKEPTHRVVLLGAQPVWNPNAWYQTISKKRSLRELTRRAVSRGVTVEETAAAAIGNSAEHQACLNEWLSGRKLPIFRFLIDPNVLKNTSGRRFFSARQNGKLLSFLSLVRVPGRNGWLIEHIFRGQTSLKGTNELLADSVIRLIAKEGAAYVTLGLAPFSKKAGLSYAMNPVWIRAIFNWLYSSASHFYNFSGLDNFKSKFKPHRWEPVYAIINKPRFCPLTFYRIAGAFCSSSPILFGLSAAARALTD